MKKIKLDPNFLSPTKINLKWTKNLTGRSKAIKFLKEHIEQGFIDIGFDTDVLKMALKEQERTEKKSASRMTLNQKASAQEGNDQQSEQTS